LISIEGDFPLILDLGTGLRALGEFLQPSLSASGRPLQATALLTHLHFDHILGLPFLAQLHDPGAELTVHGPIQEGSTLKETLHNAVQPPFFPVQMAEFRSEIAFVECGDDDFAIGAAKVKSRLVPHPGNTLGFRIEVDGKVLVYLPDHQAPLDRHAVHPAALELCEGADLLLHDAQYTDEEFMIKADWGHSTIAYAVHVAAEAGAKKLLLFHHDPLHSDRDLERLENAARKLPEARRVGEVSAAQEGVTIDIGRT